MSNSSSSSSSSGIGFAGALTIAFIVLKLCNVIDWSWWWVLSPSLISIAIVVLLLCVLGLIAIWPEKKKVKQARDDGQHIKKSKFMQKLEDAMAESDRKRNLN